MWSEESAFYMGWPNHSDVKACACQWASRLTYWRGNNFRYQDGMALWALAYLMDAARGESLTVYAGGVVSFWGRNYFPFAYAQVNL